MKTLTSSQPDDSIWTFEWMRTAASVAAFAAPLAVYLLTMARDVTFTDSGELIAAVSVLGIAHPPGYPLFCLLGRLFSMLPAGTPAFRVGLLSAVSASATSLLLYRAGLSLFRRLPPAEGRRADAAAALAPLAGSLLFAFCRTVWFQAVVAEVYALEGLLVFAFLWAGLRVLEDPRASLRVWIPVLFLWALTLTNHMSAFMLAPALLFLATAWVLQARRIGGSQGTPLRALPAAAAPLLLYLYLPLRSRAGPAVRWDYPETFHRFWVHVSARQYQGKLAQLGSPWPELRRFLAHQLPAEAGWWLPALALVGLLVLFRHRPRSAVFLLLAAAGLIAGNILYGIHDISLYYLPVLAVAAFWACIGASWLAHAVGRWRPAAGLAAAALLCLTCLFPLRAHWRENDYHDFHLLSRYVRDALKYAPPRSVVFSGRWDSFSSPALYLQVVERERPDVLILDMGRLSSPVLARLLQGPAPELVRSCADEMAGAADLALRAERREPMDVRQASARYRAFLDTLVHRSVELRPTFITEDLTRSPLFRGFTQRPEGLLTRLAANDDYAPFALPEFEGPGVAPAHVRFSEELRVMNEYYRMLLNRAAYERRFHREEEAVGAEHLAGQLSPWRN